MRLSKTLKAIVLILPILALLHGIEEYYYGLNSFVHDSMLSGASLLPLFSNFSSIQSIYIVYLGMLVLLLFIVALLLLNSKIINSIILVLIGLIFIYQTHHILETLQTQQYNPGLYTSFLFLFLGIIYWKELYFLFKRPSP